MFKNTELSYIVMLMASTKKSFEELGRMIGKSGKTISRWLRPAEVYNAFLIWLAMRTFREKEVLYLILDDTLLKKIYSKYIEGSGRFFDTKLGRRITGLKLLVAMISDGKIALPLNAVFLFSSELVPTAKETKNEWIKKIILQTITWFGNTKIYVLGDGAFGTKDFLRWCKAHNILFVGRIRKSAVVTVQGEKKKLSEIETLIPKGNRHARIISVRWDDISLFITSYIRVDKNQKETLVFHVSTFAAKPTKIANLYKKRWAIEKCFRTSKQKLGLESCFSTQLKTQETHVSAVLLAYSLTCLEARRLNIPNPESALRAAKLKNVQNINRHLCRLNRYFSEIHV